MLTLILDNYDSFTHNLAQLIGAIDRQPMVVRNDAVSVAEVRKLNPDRIVISPGPGRPDDAAYFGICGDVIRDLGVHVPVLGVCLGHQGVGHVFGGRVVRSEPMHGKTSIVTHSGTDVFAGLPSQMEVMRYHSLVVEPDSLPSCLVVTARSEDGVIMGLRHRARPIYGVQFHPESFGTPDGHRLLRNFLVGV